MACQNDGLPAALRHEGLHVFGVMQYGEGRWGCYPCENLLVHAYYNGSGWEFFGPPPPELGSDAKIRVVGNEIYAAAGGKVHRWTQAQGWTKPWTSVGQLDNVDQVDGSGPDDLWAVGRNVVEHWDGSAWTTVPALVPIGSCRVSPGAEGCYCPEYGIPGGGCDAPLVCEPQRITCCPAGTECAFEPRDPHYRSVFANARDDVWIGADFGTFHFDGTSWSGEAESGQAVAIWSLDGSTAVTAGLNRRGATVVSESRLLELDASFWDLPRNSQGYGHYDLGKLLIAGSEQVGVWIDAGYSVEQSGGYHYSGGFVEHLGEFLIAEGHGVQLPARPISLITTRDGSLLRTKRGLVVERFNGSSWSEQSLKELDDLLRDEDPRTLGEPAGDAWLHAVELNLSGG